MEWLRTALQGIDSSSGSLGNAVGKTVHELIDILLAAPADEPTLERRLDRLWAAIEESRKTASTFSPRSATAGARYTAPPSALSGPPTTSCRPCA
jgi:hypothetical protein